MYRTVLVTTDGSDLAAEAFPHVARIVGEGSEVILMSVIDTMSRVLASATLGAAEVTGPGAVEAALESVEAQREAAETYLAEQQAAMQAATAASVRTTIAGGNPGEEIVRCAQEEGADIIVMATHGRSGWRRTFLGSVADHVVRHAEGIPVLLVHPPAAD
jgi:nucleotide-binding universal stress UspA family protein